LDLGQEAQIKAGQRGHVDEFCSMESLNALLVNFI
jgi:hypothetical protein